MTANGVVSWIEYVASLAAAVRLSHRDRRGQACPEHQAGADLELHPDRLASRASHGVHDAAQGRLTGEPACLAALDTDPSPAYGDGSVLHGTPRLTGQLALDRCAWACHQARRAEPAQGACRPHVIARHHDDAPAPSDTGASSSTRRAEPARTQGNGEPGKPVGPASAASMARICAMIGLLTTDPGLASARLASSSRLARCSSPTVSPLRS